jgi:hypothetical protein
VGDHPEEARRAGEETLPSNSEPSESEYSDQEMESGVEKERRDGELQELASKALNELNPGGAEPNGKAPGVCENGDDKGKSLSEHIQSDAERSEGPTGKSESDHNRMDVDPKVSDDAVGGLLALKSPNAPPSTLATATPPVHAQSDVPTNGSLKSDSIPPYRGSTLLAITPMPPPNLPPQPNSNAVSHSERPNLPPLHSHLNQLAEPAKKESTQPYDPRANGASSGPPPTASAGLAGPGRPRIQYMTVNALQYHQQHCSPKPPYAPAQQPESSYPLPPTTDGSAQASTGGTPRDHRMSVDKTADPAPTAPVPVGGFRCDHASCTTPPFQTQHLLK